MCIKQNIVKLLLLQVPLQLHNAATYYIAFDFYWQLLLQSLSIRYDTIEEFNVDSKAEYSA